MEPLRQPFTLSFVRQSSQEDLAEADSNAAVDRDDLDPRVARSRAAVISAATEPDLVEPDPELGVEAGLREIGHRIAAMLNDPEWARVLPALLMLKTHAHGIADLDKRMEERQNEVLRTLIRRGVEEGLLTPDADGDEASAVLVGPLFFAQLTGLVAIDAGFVERTVDRFLAAYKPE
jgi:hypothetical protein